MNLNPNWEAIAMNLRGLLEEVEALAEEAEQLEIEQAAIEEKEEETIEDLLKQLEEIPD